MIQSVNRKINRLNKKLKAPVEIPTPSKKDLILTGKVNMALSLTAFTIGIVSSSKVLIGIGVLSGIGAGIAILEKNHK